MSSSSSVSGVMSKRIIMSGDKVVAFLIVRSAVSSYYLNKGRSSIISNEGENVLYENVMLPIFGKIGDFAIMDEVVESDVTKALEEKYEQDILSLLGSIGRDSQEELKDVSICFEHESVYRKMVEVDKKKSKLSDRCLSFPEIEYLGFKRTGEDLESRTFWTYEHPDLKNIVVRASHYHLEVYKDGKKGERLYDEESLLNFMDLPTNSFDGFSSAQSFFNLLKTIKSEVKDIPVSKKEKKIMEELEKISLSSASEKEVSARVKEILKEAEEEFAEDTSDDDLKMGKKEAERNTYFKEVLNRANDKVRLLSPKSIFDFDEQSVVDMYHFSAAMYGTSSVFMPTLSGYNDTVANYENDLLDVLNEMK